MSHATSKIPSSTHSGAAPGPSGVQTAGCCEPDRWLYTASVCQGDTIKFTEGVFAGSYRNARFVGERVLVCKVIKDSYGALKQQHTFTLQVITCTGMEPVKKGKTIRRKGRTIYRYGVERLVWNDEQHREAVAAEKHKRGDVARAARAARRLAEEV